MRGRGGKAAVAGAVLCALALLAAPSGAAAREALHVPAGLRACPLEAGDQNVTLYCQFEFSLPASNGYRVTVSAEPEQPQVEISVEGHQASVQYSTDGTVTPTSIKASFGRLGKISMRFRPSGRERTRRVPASCLKERPPRVSSQLGTFRGSFDFHGERGYTHLVAHRAAGGLGDPLTNTKKPLSCEFRESPAQRQRELESVSLEGSPPGSGVSFSAFSLFGGAGGGSAARASTLGSGPAARASISASAPYFFLASAIERAGRVLILRFAGAPGGREDFVFDEALTSATVSPPAPFTGSGAFSRAADGRVSWTGNLAVPLPGLGTVALTGGKAELATVADHLKQFEEELQTR